VIWAPLKNTVTSLIFEDASKVSIAPNAVLEMIRAVNNTRFFIDKEFKTS
jgi:hypothetical protein